MFYYAEYVPITKRSIQGTKNFGWPYISCVQQKNSILWFPKTLIHKPNAQQWINSQDWNHNQEYKNHISVGMCEVYDININFQINVWAQWR